MIPLTVGPNGVNALLESETKQKTKKREEKSFYQVSRFLEMKICT